MEALGHRRPTHVFLQAGVGSMAGGVLGWLAHRYGEQLPIVTIVEPETVACIYESARLGRLAAIGGNPETVMAGLNCGEPNPYIWPILRDFASFYAKCPDWVTELGMRQLAHPRPGDAPVVSGESGAVGLGLVAAVCGSESYVNLREQLGLNEHSVVLVFSTEGNTDPEHYRQVVELAKE
jgi:diaminopropionate ammonia-lyase